jgi:hypothetical protein
MKTDSKIYRLLMEVISNHDEEHSREEIDRFENMPTLEEAIATAAESRKENGQPYSHQQKTWNFWGDSVPKAKKILLDHAAELRACATFDEVHELVTSALAGIKGLKVMYCYDVAVRIGAFLGRLPKKVYLHLGTLRGAKLLDLPTKRGYLNISELPPELRAFQPYEIEDMLCHLAHAAKPRKRKPALC